MSTDAAPPTLTRAQRLDRLPFTREHGRLVVGSGVGWAPPSAACPPTASAGARSSR
ncbi:hypothetical protein [Geodermatophilus maliterrae]|uniref:Uncharacterized protein n=1 Tax=Geodermatophilus maliterrae TaxID=3162531 RepID=A0ABV3XE65_9ACTN